VSGCARVWPGEVQVSHRAVGSVSGSRRLAGIYGRPDIVDPFAGLPVSTLVDHHRCRSDSERGAARSVTATHSLFAHTIPRTRR